MPHMKQAPWRVTALLAVILGLAGAIPSTAGEIVINNPPLSPRAQAIGRPVAPRPVAQQSYGQGVPVPGQTIVVRTTPSAYGQGSSGYVNRNEGYSVSERVEDWKNYGGARLYWRAVSEPRQLRTGGVAFIDPAAFPYLFATERKVQPRRRTVRRATTQATAKPVQKVPAGVSSTKLRAPTAPAAPATPPAPPVRSDGAGSVSLQQQAAPQRRPQPPKVTTEVWNPVAPVTAAVTPPLPFLKGN